MASIKWDSTEFLENENLVEFNNRKQGRQRNRKWRESEQIKQQQKPRREKITFHDDEQWR